MKQWVGLNCIFCKKKIAKINREYQSKNINLFMNIIAYSYLGNNLLIQKTQIQIKSPYLHKNYTPVYAALEKN